MGPGSEELAAVRLDVAQRMLLSTLPRRLSAVQSNITTMCVPHGTSCLCKAVLVCSLEFLQSAPPPRLVTWMWLPLCHIAPLT